jgi:hypothetical protein
MKCGQFQPFISLILVHDFLFSFPAPQSVLACLELINELLSNMQAKVKLLRNVASLHSTVDAALHWCVVLVASALRAMQIPADTLKLTGVLLTGKVDVNSVGTSEAVQFAAGEGKVPCLRDCLDSTLLLLIKKEHFGSGR